MGRACRTCVPHIAFCFWLCGRIVIVHMSVHCLPSCRSLQNSAHCASMFLLKKACIAYKRYTTRCCLDQRCVPAQVSSAEMVGGALPQAGPRLCRLKKRRHQHRKMPKPGCQCSTKACLGKLNGLQWTEWMLCSLSRPATSQIRQPTPQGTSYRNDTSQSHACVHEK